MPDYLTLENINRYMGRKAEIGISYYQVKCNHTANKKIKLLICDHDSDGYWIWQCILAYGYNKRGYYFDLNDTDELLLFAQDDCKKPIHLVKEVIISCLNRGLFDKGIHENFNVLTSEHMQEMYLFATGERRKKGTIIELINEYLLIEIKETVNISIVLLNNEIVPDNNSIIPGNNSIIPNESEIVSPIIDDKLDKEKNTYSNLAKDKRSVFEYIKISSPKFPEPYVDMWNIWAAEYGKPKLTTFTQKRKTHLMARLKEPKFNYIEILAKAAKSAICLEGTWFSFDWITKSQDNYIKLLEGNYDNKPKPASTQAADPSSSTDEKFKQHFQG